MKPRVEVAERAGTETRPSEDVVVVLPHAVVLLDGATSRAPDLPSGGWYAARLAGELTGRLTGYPAMDLADLVAAAITAVARDHSLTPDRSPSSTVAVLRWSDETVEGLVLADSPIVVFTEDGPSVLSGETNQVAEANPDVAYNAERRSWPRAQVVSALLASDGVSCGVDRNGTFPDWTAVHALATAQGPDAVLAAVRAAESGDQALAVVEFGESAN